MCCPLITNRIKTRTEINLKLSGIGFTKLAISFKHCVNFLLDHFIHRDERRPLAFETFARNFLRRVYFHFFFSFSNASGKAVSSAPESARQTTRPSGSSRRIVPPIEPRRVL